jgi:hypothetical protein
MVLQSEIIDEHIIPYTGESATVNYTDNALDTVNFSITATEVATENNEITVTSLMTSTEGNGDIFNSALLKTSAGATNKVLFTEFTKDVNTQVQIIIKNAFFVQ